MKLSSALFLLVGLSASAATVQFGLSPAGTDVATGLSPKNVVPPVVASNGSGDVVSGGINLNTDTGVLQLALGYGSASGFTDLTGPAQAIKLLGPAAPGANATDGFDLTLLSFPAPDAAKGGVVVGTITLPTAVISNFVAGFYYVEVDTAAFPQGELRGQAVALGVPNQVPIVSCGTSTNVECGSPATALVLVSDPEGDAMTVVWNVNGVAVLTNAVPASSPPAAVPLTYQAVLPLGTNVVSVDVTDAANNTASCSTLIAVMDTTPPVIKSVTANPAVLWPPNHKMVPITLRVQPTDACGPTTWKIVKVCSNEPVNGLGDGDTAPDWQIIGDHGLKLRAERSGKGNGRIYTIVVQAADESGNLSRTKSVAVCVPKNQGRGR